MKFHAARGTRQAALLMREQVLGCRPGDTASCLSPSCGLLCDIKGEIYLRQSITQPWMPES